MATDNHITFAVADDKPFANFRTVGNPEEAET